LTPINPAPTPIGPSKPKEDDKEGDDKKTKPLTPINPAPTPIGPSKPVDPTPIPNDPSTPVPTPIGPANPVSPAPTPLGPSTPVPTPIGPANPVSPVPTPLGPSTPNNQTPVTPLKPAVRTGDGGLNCILFIGRDGTLSNQCDARNR
jgi:hypothetical protein